MRALAIAYHATVGVLALGALVACLVLFLLWRGEHRKAEAQKAQQHKLALLAIDTADTVLLQDETSQKIVSSQQDLIKVVQALKRQQETAPSYYAAPVNAYGGP